MRRVLHPDYLKSLKYIHRSIIILVCTFMSRLQSSWLADLMRTDSGLKNEIGVRKLVYDLKKRWRGIIKTVSKRTKCVLLLLRVAT